MLREAVQLLQALPQVLEVTGDTLEAGCEDGEGRRERGADWQTGVSWAEEHLSPNGPMTNDRS